MALIKLVDKGGNEVKSEDVPHDKNSLQPLPRKIAFENTTYSFSHIKGITYVYEADY